jgi:hypothetical protein
MTKAQETVTAFNASDHADAYYASFADMLRHVAEQHATFYGYELIAMLVEAADRLDGYGDDR